MSAENPLPPAQQSDIHAPQNAAKQQRAQIHINDSKVIATYAIFCRVTGNTGRIDY